MATGTNGTQGASGHDGTNSSPGGTNGGNGGAGQDRIETGADVYVTGGNGGNGGVGGRGADMYEPDEPPYYGAGGSGGTGGLGGAGGDASLTLANLTFTGDLTYVVTGGTGGFGQSGGMGGNGASIPGEEGRAGDGGEGGDASLVVANTAFAFVEMSLAAIGGDVGLAWHYNDSRSGNASLSLTGSTFTGTSDDDSLTISANAACGSLYNGYDIGSGYNGTATLAFSGNSIDGGAGNNSFALDLHHTVKLISWYLEWVPFVAMGNISLDLGAGTLTVGAGANTISHVSTVDFSTIEEGYVDENRNYNVVSSHVTMTGSDADETLIGSLANYNVLDGAGGNDALTGGNKEDSLTGGIGNDVLDGGSGADILTGGANDDTYYVDDAGDKVVEANGQGHDTIQSSASYSLYGTYVEALELTGAGNLNGTGNSQANVLGGNGGANILTGLGGNDMLDGAGGADVMIGGLGDDTYAVDNADDVVTEASGQGDDRINSAVSYSLAGIFVETLYLTGTDTNSATGNSQANILIGNGGANTMTGLGGNDTLDGGAGADLLVGGKGDDTYVVDDVSDVVKEVTGQGNDIINASVSFSLAGTFVETLNLTGTAYQATGNGQDNILIGNDADNRFVGGYGHDTLTGGLGADAFYFGFGSGADTITDFSAGQNDRINIHSYTKGVEQAGYIAQVGGDTVISLGGGNVITVTGATMADVSAHIIW